MRNNWGDEAMNKFLLKIYQNHNLLLLHVKKQYTKAKCVCPGVLITIANILF